MENQGLPTTKVVRYFGFCDIDQKVISHSCDTRPPVGLRNLGSTCWFNVAVQLLYHIPSFRQLILEFRTQPASFSTQFASPEVINGLQELFISIMYSERKLIDPSRAVHSIGKLLGQGKGQQDASEFLGVVLNRIREISPPVIENLFIGSCSHINSEGTVAGYQEFMQYPLQVNQNTTLTHLLELSLKNQINGLPKMPLRDHQTNFHVPFESQNSFSNLPPVFYIDLSRLENGSSPSEWVKSSHRLTFPSLIFMDRFLLENADQTLKLDRSLINSLLHSKMELENNLTSLQILKQSIPQLEKVYENYQDTVKFNTDVDFDQLRALNVVWDAEIQLKINDLQRHSKKIELQLDCIRNREFTTLRPYQLHAVIVHYGQSNSGHYCIYVWDGQQNHWYQIDDTTSRQVTWDSLVEVSFGGENEDNVSAHCLVYIDASKSNSILNLEEEYHIGPTDVLRYLKDHTDVRTRHSAYGKSQTMKATLTTINENQPDTESSSLLYRVLDSERKRLYSICENLADPCLEEEKRLLHFGAYLVANKVDFEPFIYWSLLQHFSSFSLLVEEKFSRVCVAARRALAFVECSTTQEQKKLFIQWNTAYYQFRLIVRHVMNGITNVFVSNFSAAVPLALKALYLHHCLTNNSLKGPAMSVNPKVIHSLIRKSVTALSEELIESDIESIGDIVCSVLFDAIINWCEYASSDHLEAARVCSRQILAAWTRQVTRSHGRAVESAFGLRTLTEIQRKLDKVESVLNKPDEKGNPTPFDFKGHIPECPEDGEKLSSKWKQMWIICTEQHVLDV